MSNLPIDSDGSDKEKVLAAFGGKKGLIDSGIPSVTFLLVFPFTQVIVVFFRTTGLTTSCVNLTRTVGVEKVNP